VITVTDNQKPTLAIRDTPRPVLENDKGIKCVCPGCREFLMKIEVKGKELAPVSFCKWCGQTLDWGEKP